MHTSFNHPTRICLCLTIWLMVTGGSLQLHATDKIAEELIIPATLDMVTSLDHASDLVAESGATNGASPEDKSTDSQVESWVKSTTRLPETSTTLQGADISAMAPADESAHLPDSSPQRKSGWCTFWSRVRRHQNASTRPAEQGLGQEADDPFAEKAEDTSAPAEGEAKAEEDPFAEKAEDAPAGEAKAEADPFAEKAEEAPAEEAPEAVEGEAAEAEAPAAEEGEKMAEDQAPPATDGAVAEEGEEEEGTEQRVFGKGKEDAKAMDAEAAELKRQQEAEEAARKAGSKELIDTILYSNEYHEQAKARDALIAIGPGVTNLVQPLLTDLRPVVRIFGILVLRDVGGRPATEAIFGLLNDQDATIRYHAGLALVKMTGKEVGYYYDDLAPSRLEAIEKWRTVLGIRKPKATAEDAADKASGGKAPTGASLTAQPSDTPTPKKKTVHGPWWKRAPAAVANGAKSAARTLKTSGTSQPGQAPSKKRFPNQDHGY